MPSLWPCAGWLSQAPATVAVFLAIWNSAIVMYGKKMNRMECNLSMQPDTLRGREAGRQADRHRHRQGRKGAIASAAEAGEMEGTAVKH